jgi:hypothetical protein
MPLILSSNLVTSDPKTQPSREAQFGRQRFLNENEQTVCTRVLCFVTYLQPKADSSPLAAVYLEKTHARRHINRYSTPE